MVKYDVHMHTAFSSDSKEEAENQVKRAIELGLKGICVTDHMDIDFPEKDLEGIDFLFNPDEYFVEMKYLQEKYKKQIDMLIGMEIGLRNEPDAKQNCIDGYRELVNKYPFDFIIGSTHCLVNHDPYYPVYWENRDAKQGLHLYFEAILENIRAFDDYDTVGHLDYLVRYVKDYAIKAYIEKNPHFLNTDGIISNDSRYLTIDKALDTEVFSKYGYRVADYADLLDEILKCIIEKGKALEINTAGLKYGIGFAHPKKEILLRYKELGGELITVGSDAHKSEHVAYDFDKASELLKDLGYKHYYIYRERKPEGICL